MIALRLFLAFVLLTLPTFAARKGNSSGTQVLTGANTLNVTGAVTYCFWVKRITTITNGRLVDVGNPYAGLTEGQVIYIATADSAPVFESSWSTSQGLWKDASAVSTSWEHFCILYDNGSTSNNATGYRNGVNDSWSTDTVPSGTSNAGTRLVAFLNRRGGSDRPVNAEMAEFGFWKRNLTAAEITALAAGYSPKCFPASLTVYVAMDNGDAGNEKDIMSGGIGVVTESGTIGVTAHPRIIKCE